MNAFKQAIATINFDEQVKIGGEYGLHDGFFNAVCQIDGVDYHFQGCADNDKFDPRDCGHDEGICYDVNYDLAVALDEKDNGIGFVLVRELLERAWEIYEAE